MGNDNSIIDIIPPIICSRQNVLLNVENIPEMSEASINFEIEIILQISFTIKEKC